MSELLDALLQYANLLMVVITFVLAMITFAYFVVNQKMLSEMRSARESQMDAHLVVGPVPYFSIGVQVELHNAGPGPALDVTLTFGLEPSRETQQRTWSQSAITVGQTEHFLLPGETTELRQLADQYETLLIETTWKNVFGQAKSTTKRHNLRQLADGWYNANCLLRENEPNAQLKEIATKIGKLVEVVEKAAR